MASASKASSRTRLLLVAALFLTPFIIAAALRFTGWQPPQTKNFGHLYQPPVSMETWSVKDAEGKPVAWVNEQRTWRLISLAPAHCDQPCQQHLDALSRMHDALGRHGKLLKKHWLLTDEAKQSAFIQSLPAPLAQELTPLVGHDALIKHQPKAMPEKPNDSEGGDERTEVPATFVLSYPVYAIDPHGYLVLYYAPGQPARELKKDLSRVVKS